MRSAYAASVSVNPIIMACRPVWVLHLLGKVSVEGGLIHMGVSTSLPKLNGNCDTERHLNPLNCVKQQHPQLFVKNVKVSDMQEVGSGSKFVTDYCGRLWTCECGLAHGIPVSAQAVVSEALKILASFGVVGDDHPAHFQLRKLLRYAQEWLLIRCHVRFCFPQNDDRPVHFRAEGPVVTDKHIREVGRECNVNCVFAT